MSRGESDCCRSTSRTLESSGADGKRCLSFLATAASPLSSSPIPPRLSTVTFTLRFSTFPHPRLPPPLFPLPPPPPHTHSINELSNVDLKFPIIADEDRKIATLYDMLDEQDATNKDDKGIPFTVRSVFVIDPQKKIRLTLQYPASTGRQFNEILRCIDSLQLGDRRKVTTPGE